MNAAVAGLDPCVHCGFCLQSCPTYVATGDEADGPRGRIVLMQQLARGQLDLTDERLAYHLDRCLGCRACESACPSGVVYGPALEETRAALVRVRPLGLVPRIVLAVMADRRLRGPVFALSRLARPLARFLAGKSTIGFQMGMLAATRMVVNGRYGPSQDRTGSPLKGETGSQVGSLSPGRRAGSETADAAVFQGCIMEGLFAHVNAATERTLRANGFSITEIPRQGCCGALHAHAGQHDQAVTLARGNVLAFSHRPDTTVVVNSAGCGAILKDYGRLLAGDKLENEAKRFAARVKDVSEVLAAAGPRTGAPLELTVAVDPPCHLQHAQGVTDAPLTVLAGVPGLKCRSPAEAAHCCGSAGVYSLVEPELSRKVLARKLENLDEISPDVIATGNPGCIMQLGAGVLASGRGCPVLHPVELLDLSYRKAGYYAS